MVRLIRRMIEADWRRLAVVPALALGGLALSSAAGRAAEPHPWELGMQPSATPVHEHLAWLHNVIVLPIIIAITIFVLGLLLYVMVRFHHTRNPVPTRITHNTPIEIAWTVVPVLILVAIAIPSFKLMYYMDREPNADMTIKVTGHQWYWEYGYPDQGNFSFNSNIIPDDQLTDKTKRMLDVDNPLVVPVGAKVRVLVTGTDVIHSWFIPSFGVQEYAVQGRNNESWFQVEKPGAYYGECNQICGINHSRMPIKVVAMAKPDFDKWLADAKKKFAAAPGPDDNTRVAAVADGAQAARVTPPPAGN